MNLKTLRTKPKIADTTSVTNSKKLDMTEPTLILKNEVRIRAYHPVSEYEEGRLDLVSLKYYATDTLVDIICKANGISNPFAVPRGTILVIPDKRAATKAYQAPKTIKNNPRDQFVESKRASQKDKARTEFLKNQSSKRANGSKQNLPPNMLKSGEKYKKVQDNGTILLGANMKTTSNPKVNRK
tara:strand:- start:6010 stop:6561 length:552 start_codon:yes stop_codon:yes gene_type:complete